MCDLFQKKMTIDIVKEWKQVNLAIHTKLTSALPIECTPVKLTGGCSLASKLDVVEEWGEEQWELPEWQVDAALGLGPWDWASKPRR